MSPLWGVEGLPLREHAPPEGPRSRVLAFGFAFESSVCPVQASRGPERVKRGTGVPAPAPSQRVPVFVSRFLNNAFPLPFLELSVGRATRSRRLWTASAGSPPAGPPRGGARGLFGGGAARVTVVSGSASRSPRLLRPAQADSALLGGDARLGFLWVPRSAVSGSRCCHGEASPPGAPRWAGAARPCRCPRAPRRASRTSLLPPRDPRAVRLDPPPRLCLPPFWLNLRVTQGSPSPGWPVRTGAAQREAGGGERSVLGVRSRPPAPASPPQPPQLSGAGVSREPRPRCSQVGARRVDVPRGVGKGAEADLPGPRSSVRSPQPRGRGQFRGDGSPSPTPPSPQPRAAFPTCAPSAPGPVASASVRGLLRPPCWDRPFAGPGPRRPLRRVASGAFSFRTRPRRSLGPPPGPGFLLPLSSLSPSRRRLRYCLPKPPRAFGRFSASRAPTCPF